MQRSKREHLAAAGWRTGDAAEFLGLTPAEAAYVELKVALAGQLRARRRQRGLSQAALARTLGSSQSRVAKMERADPTVSADLLIRALLALGSSRRDVASAIGRPRKRN
jgi:predicted XRE-type DNA-binding protein